MQQNVKQLVDRFRMLPHPEGGYFKETYRSAELVNKESLPERFAGDRHFSTAIYFLLEQGNFSAFHRIKSDECWHFYAGYPLLIHVIYPDGMYEMIRLGNHFAEGQHFQSVVPAGCWFASETAPGGSYSFVGCTVSPGFDFADFELAVAADLEKLCPAKTELIRQLCRQS